MIIIYKINKSFLLFDDHKKLYSTQCGYGLKTLINNLCNRSTYGWFEINPLDNNEVDYIKEIKSYKSMENLLTNYEIDLPEYCL